MVVIVKENSINKSPFARGKSLCHPGLQETNRFDYHYDHYFENRLFGRKCDSDKTTVESRVSSLSEHFEMGCVPGPWSLDRDLDAELKKRYPNLCELCYEAVTCDETDRYHGTSGAVSCLLNAKGELLTWLDRNQLTADDRKRLISNGFGLLCPDGTIHNLTDNHTCTWIEDPRPVIVADGNVVELVRDLLVDESKSIEAVQASYLFDTLQRLNSPVDVNDYLEKFPAYKIARTKALKTCPSEKKVRWCVLEGAQTRMCRSLEQAAESIGPILPGFTCVSKSSRETCLQALDSGFCEVYVADFNQTTATTIFKYGVKSIIDLVGHQRDDFNTIAAIVKSDSSYQNYKDLKGTKACFIGYQSVGWNAFYSKLRNESNEDDCNDIEVISSYFKDSCVLGIEDETDKFPSNLNSLCNQNDSELGVGERTFRCLTNGADVAFMNVGSAKNDSKKENIVFDLNYRLVSSTGFEDCSQNLFKCALARVGLGSVLVNVKIKKTRENDINLMFLAFDSHFGRSYDRETPLFDLYKRGLNVFFSGTVKKMQKVIPGSPYFEVHTKNSNSLTCRPVEISQSSHTFLYTFTLLVIVVGLFIYCNRKYKLLRAIFGN